MTDTPNDNSTKKDDRPEWGLTPEELARVRSLVTTDPRDDEDPNAEVTPEEIEGIILAPDFGLPKNVRNINHENVENVLAAGVAALRDDARSSARKLLTIPTEDLMRVLNERETMSRTLHYAIAKQEDVDAIIERLGERTTEQGPAGAALEFLWRQKSMAKLLERLLCIDAVLRLGKELRDERFDELAKTWMEPLIPKLVVAIRKFVDGNADAVAGSLHVKILTDEMLRSLTEREVDAMLDQFYTETCIRFADLISADLSQFNSWRLRNALET